MIKDVHYRRYSQERSDVKVIGVEEPCIGFFWLDSMNRLRGLVCLKSDEEAVQEAREKMNRKDDFI